MFTALIRGFATAPLGSPLTITLTLILSILPALRWWTVLPWGVLTTMMLLLFGWMWGRARVLPRGIGAQSGRAEVIAIA